MCKRTIIVTAVAAVVALIVAPCAYFAYRLVSSPVGSDSATTEWLGRGIGDVDGDGCGDVAVSLRFDPVTEADAFTTWIVSGRENKPLYTISIDPSLIDREHNPEFGTYTPAWHEVHELADFDRDGCADVGVSCILGGSAAQHSKTVVLSGKSGRVLLDDLPSSRNWAAGPNCETLGDANGDATPDLLITISGDSLHGIPARVAILSGVDGSEIRSIESTPRPIQLKGFPNAIASSYFGLEVCVIGDADGDTVDDFVVNDPDIQRTEGPYPTVFGYSSGTGNLLWKLDSEFDLQSSRVLLAGWEIEAFGDVDADHLVDVLVSVRPGGHRVVSGRNGTLLPMQQLPKGTTPVADFDGDGLLDFSRNYLGRVESRGDAHTKMEIVSGKTGASLCSFHIDSRTEFVSAFRSAGDVNCDGTPDIALTGDVEMVAEGRKWKPAFGVVTIHSGKDGSLLRTYDREYLREFSKGDVPSVVIR